MGDLPVGWNTNDPGETVKQEGETNKKWFKLQESTTYIPVLPSALPDNFTIELYLLIKRNSTSQNNYFGVLFSDNNTFSKESVLGSILQIILWDFRQESLIFALLAFADFIVLCVLMIALLLAKLL